MRHLGSIVLAIIFAPLIYVLAGVGEVKFVLGTATDSTDWNAVGIGIGALVVAGGLYSVLVMARISPLGPFIAAALFVAAELWSVFDQAGLVKLFGTSVLGVHNAQEAPLTGIALFMAVPLIITIVSPRRWHSNEKAVVVPADAAPAYSTSGTPVSAAPIYAPAQTNSDTAAEAAAEPAAESTPETDEEPSEESREEAREEAAEKQ